jgi:DNA-directed RNA polymerase subunit RPC12/RpoP
VTDLTLIRDTYYTVRDLGASVVMFPEASYSFDGTATSLPDSIGAFVKRLGVPVVMIRTYGAFTRDPLYNGLQRRRVRVSADMEYLLSPEQLASMTDEEIGAVIGKKFEFDHFRWQYENRVRVSEPFRADFLDRVLYKCAACGAEGRMEGKGVKLTCHACGKSYELDEYGKLRAEEGETEFAFVTDWYAWERDEVRRELSYGTYALDTDVDICMSVDTYAIYRVGEGRLTHSEKGFALTGCDGQLSYTQNPIATYSLYSDFNWYEIGDVICIGNQKALYYCFPKDKSVSVAKVRLAAEELYKIVEKTNRNTAERRTRRVRAE